MNLLHFAALVLALDTLAYRVRAEPVYAVAIGLFATGIWVLALYRAWLQSQERLRAEHLFLCARKGTRRAVSHELATLTLHLRGARAENDQHQRDERRRKVA